MKHVIVIETVDLGREGEGIISPSLEDLLVYLVEKTTERLHGPCVAFGIFNVDSAIAALHELYGAPKWEPEKPDTWIGKKNQPSIIWAERGSMAPYKIPRLTKEQAAIIGAYTGVTAGGFGGIREYSEKVLGRSIFTHEFANKDLVRELQEASKPDFISICSEEE